MNDDCQKDANFDYIIDKTKKTASIANCLIPDEIRKIIIPDFYDEYPIVSVDNLGDLVNRQIILGKNVRTFSNGMYKLKNCFIYIPKNCNIEEKLYKNDFANFYMENFLFAEKKKPSLMNFLFSGVSSRIIQVVWNSTHEKYERAVLEFDLAIKFRDKLDELHKAYNKLSNMHLKYVNGKSIDLLTFAVLYKSFIDEFMVQNSRYHDLINLIIKNLSDDSSAYCANGLPDFIEEYKSFYAQANSKILEYKQFIADIKNGSISQIENNRNVLWLDPSWRELLEPDSGHPINIPQNDISMSVLIDSIYENGVNLDYKKEEGLIKLYDRDFDFLGYKSIFFRDVNGIEKNELARDYYLIDNLHLLFYFTDTIITFEKLQEYRNSGFPENVQCVLIPSNEGIPNQSIIVIERKIEENIKSFMVDKKMYHYPEPLEKNELSQILKYIIDLLSEMMITRICSSRSK